MTDKTDQTTQQQTDQQIDKPSIPLVRTEGLPPLLPVADQTHPRTLNVIDGDITRELTAALDDDRSRIEHYKNAGLLYREAMDRCKVEGTTFQVWFDSRPRGRSIRTAYAWMSLAYYWGFVAPMLRELNPGAEANYKEMVKAAKAEARKKSGKPALKPRAKWKPTLTKVTLGSLTTKRVGLS